MITRRNSDDGAVEGGAGARASFGAAVTGRTDFFFIGSERLGYIRREARLPHKVIQFAFPAIRIPPPVPS